MCKTCKDSKDNCLQCHANMDRHISGRCDCSKGYYPNTSTNSFGQEVFECLQCDDACETCIEAGKCASCKNSVFRAPLCQSEQCEANQIFNATMCITCLETCETCSNDYSCQSCKLPEGIEKVENMPEKCFQEGLYFDENSCKCESQTYFTEQAIKEESVFCPN